MTIPFAPLMFCTVKFKELRQLKKLSLIRSLPDWKSYAQGTAHLYTHTPTGIRVRAQKRTVESVEASLARVLHGQNGKLIKDAKELAAALAAVELIVSKIAGPALSPTEYTRVDLVWQFRGHIAAYVTAFRHCRHPFIRKAAVVYSDAALCFPGKRCRITFYDKTREQTGKPGSVVRVEVSLRWNKLRALLGNGHPVASLCFRDAYRAFRSVLCKFHPRRVPKLSTLAEVLAFGEQKGIALFDYWSATKHPRTVRRVRKELGTIQVQFHRLNWRKNLASLKPPPAIEFTATPRAARANRHHP